MIRSLAAALLLLAAPAFASEVFVHLDLSDSMRAGLERGKVRAFRVYLGAPHREARIAETDSATAVVSDVDSGTWTLRTFMLVGGATYIVDPQGQQVEIGAARADVIVPVPALLIAGKVVPEGKPFARRMMLSPYKAARRSWSVNVPLDARGRFAFPLPWAGEWNVQLYDTPPRVTRVRFEERDTRREVVIDHFDSSYKYSTKDITAPSNP